MACFFNLISAHFNPIYAHFNRFPQMNKNPFNSSLNLFSLNLLKENEDFKGLVSQAMLQRVSSSRCLKVEGCFLISKKSRKSSSGYQECEKDNDDIGFLDDLCCAYFR